MQRVNRILNQVAPSEQRSTSQVAPMQTAALGKLGEKRDDDIVIVSALRTAVTRARGGGFSGLPVEDLLAPVLKQTVVNTKIDPKLIGDIVVGTVLGQNSQRANEARIAALQADIPDTVPIHIINRQCSSGLQAIAHVAASIRAGYYDIGIAAGVESMSTGAMNAGWQGPISPKIFMKQQAKDCLLPMGITSENVAARWKITRKEQDELAVSSHKKAAAAIAAGKFAAEIVPVKVQAKDPKTGATKEITVSQDDGFRPDADLAGLSKIKPAFSPTGSTTAGNASQVSDGAAAVLLCTRAKAKQLGLPVQGVFRTFAAVGVAPDVMGIGPAYAIPAALKLAGISQDDVSVYEINEAFASQACMSVKHLGLPWEKVNPNGGAIALGHPLGATGAKLTASILNELKRRGKPGYGVVSMCIGSGMGAAGVFEYEG